MKRVPMVPGNKFAALAKLLSVHYGHFMANPRFWYEPALIEADSIVCVAASDLRREINQP